MKKLTLILLIALISLSLAQPKKKVQWSDLQEAVKDSIRNTAGNITDSLDALTASNGVTKIGGRNFSLKILKDTTTAIAYKPDSANTMALLGGLSASNTLGGGLIVYKSSGSADGITSYAVTGGGIWQRVQYLEDKRINVVWAGAISGDATDDVAAFLSASRLAESSGSRRVYVPAGSYNWDSKLDLTTLGLTQDEGFIFEGDNRNETVITVADTGLYLYNALYTRRFIVRNLRFHGPGKGTAGGIGIKLRYLNSPTIENVTVEDFETCLELTRTEGMTLKNNLIQDNVWGIIGDSTFNSNVFIDNYFARSDSACIWLKSSKSAKIIGGEGGNGGGIFLRLGVENSSTQLGYASIEGINLESVGSTFFEIHHLSQLNLSDSYILSNTATYMAKVNDASTLILSNVVTTNNLIWAEAPASQVRVLEGLYGPAFFSVYNAATATWYSANNMYTVPDNAIPNHADSVRQGKFVRAYSRYSTNVPERLYYYGRFSNTEWSRHNLLNGSDWRVAIANDPSTQPAVVNGVRLVAKYFTINLSATGDSTVFPAVVDTNGWTTLYYANLMYDDAGNSGVRHVDCNIETSNGANGAGTITWVVWHNGDANLNGVTRRFRMFAIIVPREWGTN